MVASPPSTETPQPPRETLLLVSACCVLLLVLQFTTVTKLWVILTSYRGPIGEYVSRLRDIEWTLLDLTLVGLFGLCATAFLVLEVVACRWTVFLTWVTDRDARARVWVVLFSIVAARYYFTPGDLSWAADSALHTLYVWIASEGLAQGILPVSTPLVAAGTPFLQFYGFLYFYIAGIIGAISGDLHVTTKITLGATHILSGFTMYQFVRAVVNCRRAGLFAGLVYVLAFWHLQHDLIMGGYPTSLSYTLLPLPFYCLHRAGGGTDWQRWIVLGSLAVAALLSVSTNRPCFARLAYGYYPDLSVRVDGVPVETRMTAAGFAVIEIPGGDDRHLRQSVAPQKISPDLRCPVVGGPPRLGPSELANVSNERTISHIAEGALTCQNPTFSSSIATSTRSDTSQPVLVTEEGNPATRPHSTDSSNEGPTSTQPIARCLCARPVASRC